MRRAWVLLLVLAGACRQDMHDQPKLEPLEASAFFADGRASRHQVAGTVARGELDLDDHLYRGLVDGELATTFPFEVDDEVMARGQQRFEINCSVCHGRTGDGQGMAVRRGLKQPPSYHIDRLREAPPGYYFDVITNGYGAMYDLSDKITVEDRWAIVAYIRALQLSRNASILDAPPERRQQLEEARQ